MRPPWPVRRARLPVLIGLASLITLAGAFPNPQPTLGAPRPAHHRRAAAQIPPRSTARGRAATFFGFAPWWSLDSLGPADIAGQNEVAYFGLDLNHDGSVSGTGPGAAGLASPSFARLASAVHAQGSSLLLSVEALAPGSAASVISHPGGPAHLAASITPILARTGAQGVNLDLEGLGHADRDSLTSFVSSTAAALRVADARVRVVVDVTADAGSPSSAYDAAALSSAADQLFVMAYDMSGASWAGPDNALPVEATDLGRIAATAQPSKVILGVPLYARTWSTTSDAPRAPAQPSAVAVQADAQPATCPSGTQASTSTTTQSSSSGSAPNASASGPPGATSQSGSTPTSEPTTPGPQAPDPAQAIPYGVLATQSPPLWWDAQSFEAWTAWRRSGHWHEAYFDSTVAMQARGSLAARLGLGGVGLWALGMDDTEHELAAALLRGFADPTPPAAPNLPSGPGSVSDSSPPSTVVIASAVQSPCQTTSTSSSTSSTTSTTSKSTSTTGPNTSTTSTTQPAGTTPVPSSSTTTTTAAP